MSDAEVIPRFRIPPSDDDGGLESYRAAARDLFEPRARSRAARIEQNVWHLGTMMLGTFFSNDVEYERDRMLVATSGIDHLLIQHYVEGEIHVSGSSWSRHLRADDIMVLDLAQTVRAEAGRYRSVNLLLPRQFIEEAVDDPASLHGAIIPGGDPLGSILACCLTSLVARAETLDTAQALIAARATASLSATILGGCARTHDAVPEQIHSPFRTIARHVEGRLKDQSLNADSIAAELGMSRATLYRAFASVGGVADYVRRRRLANAALMLAAPENRRRKIGHIAFEWGFASEQSFTRAFKSAFGVSPGDAREHRAPLRGFEDESDAAEAEGFARWVRLLRP